MRRMSRKLILSLVLVLVIGVLGGCGKKTPKAPDNFDKDLWEDSVKIINIIYKTYEEDNNFSVEDEDEIEEYFDIYQGRQYNNNEEHKIIKDIQSLYKNYREYLFHERTYSDKSVAEKDKELINKLLQEIQERYENLIIR